MDRLTITLVAVVVVALLLKWRRPAWYWMSFGVVLAALRVLIRYRSVMDACGLTVPPSRWRLALARMSNRPVPGPRAPRVCRMRPTRTGLVLRLKLRAGQDAFDFVAATDRLRHSFAMYGVTSRELRSGIVELSMTGYDVLKRVQMPATRTEAGALKVPVALREDGAVHYRDLPNGAARAHPGRHGVRQVGLPEEPGRRARSARCRPGRDRLQTGCGTVPARPAVLGPGRQPGCCG